MFDKKNLQARLLALKPTQDSIQTLSKLISFNRANAAEVVQIWLHTLYRVRSESIICLFYLVNDVVQSKSAGAYIKEFGEIIHLALVHARIASRDKAKIAHVLQVLADRQVYSSTAVSKWLAILNESSSPTERPSPRVGHVATFAVASASDVDHTVGAETLGAPDGGISDCSVGEVGDNANIQTETQGNDGDTFDAEEEEGNGAETNEDAVSDGASLKQSGGLGVRLDLNLLGSGSGTDMGSEPRTPDFEAHDSFVEDHMQGDDDYEFGDSVLSSRYDVAGTETIAGPAGVSGTLSRSLSGSSVGGMTTVLPGQALLLGMQEPSVAAATRLMNSLWALARADAVTEAGPASAVARVIPELWAGSELVLEGRQGDSEQLQLVLTQTEEAGSAVALHQARIARTSISRTGLFPLIDEAEATQADEVQRIHDALEAVSAAQATLQRLSDYAHSEAGAEEWNARREAFKARRLERQVEAQAAAAELAAARAEEAKHVRALLESVTNSGSKLDDHPDEEEERKKRESSSESSADNADSITAAAPTPMIWNQALREYVPLPNADRGEDWRD